MAVTALSEQINKHDKALAKTGHLFGLDRLKRKEEDPGGYEALWHILSNLCNVAWEVGCKVSSSPIAVEGGDALWALHLPTGEAVCVSRGITAHPGLLADMIRSLIQMGYEDLPGFHDGDIFENNDPHYGGIHGPDFDMAMPIFYDGKLVAWASAVTHVIGLRLGDPGFGRIPEPRHLLATACASPWRRSARRTPSTPGTRSASAPAPARPTSCWATPGAGWRAASPSASASWR